MQRCFSALFFIPSSSAQTETCSDFHAKPPSHSRIAFWEAELLVCCFEKPIVKPEHWGMRSIGKKKNLKSWKDDGMNEYIQLPVSGETLINLG